MAHRLWATQPKNIQYDNHTNNKPVLFKKKCFDEGSNAIGPWGVEEFSSFKASVHQSNDKRKLEGTETAKNWKTNNLHNKNAKICKIKNENGLEEPQPIIIHIQDTGNLRHVRRRTKTQAFNGTCLTQMRVNTVNVAIHAQMKHPQNLNQMVEEHLQRKMSMHKFRTTLLQTSRSKTSSSTNFYQTRTTERQRKEKQRNTKAQINAIKCKDLMTNKLKTTDSENEVPLIFFFEAKSTKNMMVREKNIMKIRNLSKNKRHKTIET